MTDISTRFTSFMVSTVRSMTGQALVAVVALLVSLLLSGARAYGNDQVRITVHLEQPATQSLSVEISFPPAGTQQDSTEVLLPTWRPGRYAELYPANTVTSVRARDGNGGSLDVRKTGGSSWIVEHPTAAQVNVQYDVYANSLGDRTRHVDATHAFLSGSTVFAYSPAHRRLAHRIELFMPADWRIACGLERDADNPRVLLANDYDELVDAPIEAGQHDRWDFQVGGKQHSLVVWPRGARFGVERVLADLSALIEEQIAIFGSVPYERYLFLVHAGAGAGGGTEHRNSTIMQTSLAALEASADVYENRKGTIVRPKEYRRFLGLSSHEFFHTWNVKELRPAGITPYDYQGPNYSTLFWLAEGGTSYYDDLTLRRANLLTEKQYLEAISDSIDGYRSRPGNAVQSLSESSFDSWIHGYGSRPNSANRTVSFYRKGSLATLLFDLEIRRITDSERSFDDVWRLLYERHPLASGGYDRSDLEDAIVDVLEGASQRARSQLSASVDSWFASWVDGVEPLPLKRALEYVGLELVQERKGRDTEGESQPSTRADLGLQLYERDGRTVVSTAITGGPAQLAGVQAGDELVAFDGRRSSPGEVERRLRLFRPGDVVRLHLMRSDRLAEVEVELTERVDGAWSVRRIDEPSAQQKDAFEAWLHHPWKPAEEGSADDEPDDESGDEP